MEIKTKYCHVKYNETEEMKDKVFAKVIEYFTKYESFCGEGIMQSDDPIIHAPEVMAEIADDIIQFEYIDD